MSIKKILPSFLLIVIFITSNIALGYYLFFTSQGANVITRLLLTRFVDYKAIEIQKIKGSLSKVLLWENITIKDIKGLPEGSFIKIQKLEFYFTTFSLKGLNAAVFNGRLKLPASDAVLFYGNYHDGLCEFTAYSKQVSVREILHLVTKSNALKFISGTIEDLDITVKGHVLNPLVNGRFKIEKLTHKGFSINNCSGELAVQLKDIKNQVKLFGEVVLKNGIISGPDTVAVMLRQSKIRFYGEMKKTKLDFAGDAKVEDTHITLMVSGRLDKPELKVSSLPPLPQEQILIMLITGKTWRGAEEALTHGKLSADVAKDFIDYFIFAGSGSKIARYFGISNISLIYDRQTRGLEIKKTVSDKVEAAYGVEQTQAKEEEPAAIHKVKAEYKVSDVFSVGAEKELPRENQAGKTLEKHPTNDRIFLRYKKKF